MSPLRLATDMINKAREMIEDLVQRKLRVGQVYTGKVKRIEIRCLRRGLAR